MTDLDLYDFCHMYIEYKDGEIYWKESPHPRQRKGSRISHINAIGYNRVQIRGKLYLAHRIIFLMHNKYLPEIVDHIDGDRLNNDISNLRAATKAQNQRNAGNSKNNTSGYKGVVKSPCRKKWMAQITKDYKNCYLGIFECKHEAARAYNKAALELHGEFARLNEVEGEVI